MCQGDSNEYTQYTITCINTKKKNHPKLSQICSFGKFLRGTQEQVRNSRGKKAVGVRATEVLFPINLDKSLHLYHLYYFQALNKNYIHGSPVLEIRHELKLPGMFLFSPIGQEYPFLQMSEIFLSWPLSQSRL